MSIAIRSVLRDDCDEIARLNAHVQTVHAEAYPWRFKAHDHGVATAAHFLTLLAEPGRFAYLAEQDHVAVGYVLGSVIHREETPFHKPHTLVHVDHIAVAQDARRRGAGRALLDAAKTHGMRSGAVRMTLDVWSFNDTARAFFESYGLETFVERRWMSISQKNG